MSLDKLLVRLKKDLYAERVAVRVYNYQSRRVKDVDLAILLRSIASTEAHHVVLLARLIKLLGGSVDMEPSFREEDILELVDSMSTDEDILRLNIILEEKAFNSYRGELSMVGDERVASVLEAIMQDEADHARRFWQFLLSMREKKEDDGPLMVFQRVVDVGFKRLSRPWLEMFMSGVIGAIHVTFGAVAMAAGSSAAHGPLSYLVGALFFPVGFIMLKLSHSELFTENFLVPVAPVIEKGEGLFKLMRLWILTLLGNLVGAALFALLVAAGGKGSLGILPAKHLVSLAEYKFSRSFGETFISAVFAGAIITTMTWLVISAKDEISKLVAVWSCIFVMAVGGFTHVVVSTSEVLLGWVYGARFSFDLWFERLFVPATLGNTLGGIVLIALLHYLQVLHTKKAYSSYIERRNAALESAVKEKLRL